MALTSSLLLPSLDGSALFLVGGKTETGASVRNVYEVDGGGVWGTSDVTGSSWVLGGKRGNLELAQTVNSAQGIVYRAPL